MKVLPYIIIVITVFLSAFFSGSELALTNVNKLRLSNEADDGDKKAARALKLANDYDKMLSGVLIGNNLVNILCSSMATLVFLRFIPNNENLASIVSTAVMTVIILIFGEIVPKLAAKKNPESFAKTVSLPIRIVVIVFYPLILISLAIMHLIIKKKNEEDEPTVTEDELVGIIDTVEKEGVIGEESGEMLRSAIEFNDMTLNEIITPRTDVLLIDADSSNGEILDIALNSRFSRIPVFEDTVDNIIGILYLNRYFREVSEKGAENVDIREMLMEPIYFHKAMKLPTAFDRMRSEKTHIAIVIDEFGGTLGIVTMEDILEEIVGDIWDENDEIENEITHTAENTYEVLGDMNIYDFFEEMELDEDELETDYSTVGGWAIEMLDGDPHEGDTFTYKNLFVVVTEMQDMRVIKLTVLVKHEEEEED